MAEKVLDSAKPVYIPWKAFEGYISGLKGTVVPHKLDTSAKPPSMNGSLWRQVTSALQFLGLIDSEKTVSTDLEELAAAHGTEQWAIAVKEHVLPAYAGLVDELPLENATQGQLNKCFREKGSVDGQMLSKCVRFYVHALKESGEKFSPHFSLRKESSNGTRKRKASRKKTTKNKPDEDQSPPINPVERNTPTGMIDFPIPMGDVTGHIRVRGDLTMEQFPMVEAMLNAVKVLAETNTANVTTENK